MMLFCILVNKWERIICIYDPQDVNQRNNQVPFLPINIRCSFKYKSKMIYSAGKNQDKLKFWCIVDSSVDSSNLRRKSGNVDYNFKGCLTQQSCLENYLRELKIPRCEDSSTSLLQHVLWSAEKWKQMESPIRGDSWIGFRTAMLWSRVPLFKRMLSLALKPVACPWGTS